MNGTILCFWLQAVPLSLWSVNDTTIPSIKTLKTLVDRIYFVFFLKKHKKYNWYLYFFFVFLKIKQLFDHVAGVRFKSLSNQIEAWDEIYLFWSSISRYTILWKLIPRLFRNQNLLSWEGQLRRKSWTRLRQAHNALICLGYQFEQLMVRVWVNTIESLALSNFHYQYSDLCHVLRLAKEQPITLLLYQRIKAGKSTMS